MVAETAERLEAPRSISLRVVERRNEAEGIVSLIMVPAVSANLPAFQAGSHLEIQVGPGISRNYSLCNDPADRQRYRLGILLEPKSRGGSDAVHRTFMPGHEVIASVPRNNFELNENAEQSILVAGGIGVTPMIAMAYRLRAIGLDYQLHYCCRTRARAAFLDELQDRFEGRLFVHLDDGQPSQRFDAATTLASPRAGQHLYVCGPSGFMDHVVGVARELAWRRSNVHTEYFSATVETAGWPFSVRAARSGVLVRVSPGKTIAQALVDAGVDVPMSCKQGVCGTCLVPVLSGVPDHRDLFQTDAEKAANSHVTVCCSRSHSPELVIDI